jgi:uncharacterized iron-regulated membrane protein
MLRKIAFQIHLWLGLFAGAILLVLGLSGSLLVFRPALDRSAYRSGTHSPSTKPASATPLEDGRRAVESANPDHRIRFVMPAGGVNQFLLFPRKGAAYNPLMSSADAVTGELFSNAPLKSGWLYWVRDLHSNLLAGPNGRTVNGVVALVLTAMCASGLVIWLPKQHWRLSFRAGWKRQVWNLHNAAGIFALVLLLSQGFIGAYFAFPEVYRAALGLPARAKADAEESGNTARAAKKHGHQKAEPGAPAAAELPLDVFVKKAHETWPEYKIAAIYPPARSNQPMTVRGRMPGDPVGRDDMSRLTFDPHSGRLMRAQQGSQLVFGEKVISQMQAIHYGRFQDSLVSHIVWVLLGLAPGTLYITGLIMWLNRMKAKRRVRRVMKQRLQSEPEPALTLVS